MGWYANSYIEVKTTNRSLVSHEVEALFDWHGCDFTLKTTCDGYSIHLYDKYAHSDAMLKLMCLLKLLLKNNFTIMTGSYCSDGGDPMYPNSDQKEEIYNIEVGPTDKIPYQRDNCYFTHISNTPVPLVEALPKFDLNQAIVLQHENELTDEQLSELARMKTSNVVDCICIDAILAGHMLSKHITEFNVFPYQWRTSSKEEVKRELERRGYEVDDDDNMLHVKWV